MWKLWPVCLLALASCASHPRAGAELKRTGDEIVICGRYFHTGAPVVLWTDPGGFDAYRMSSTVQSNPERLTRTGSTWFPVFSPDGSTLAFHVGRDVYTMPSGGGELRRLTHDPANGMYPSWAPDGRRLVFMTWRSGRTELYVMNADGSDQRKLMDVDRGDAIDPRWSPDGSRIAFVHMPDGMNGNAARICTVGADGAALNCVR